jgi:cytochrome b6-f complex iron-sulfur subunit
MLRNAKMGTLSRRNFLKYPSQVLLVDSGLLGMGPLLRLLGFPTEPPPPTQSDLDPASHYLKGSHTFLSDIQAVLLHTEAGFSALSLVCTHLGCTLEQKTDGFTCPCHGYHFGVDGTAVRGPVENPFAPLRVEQTAEDHLILYRV